MPTITIRVSDGEKAELEAIAHSEGVTLSEVVRAALSLRAPVDVVGGMLSSMETLARRMARLERLANLD